MVRFQSILGAVAVVFVAFILFVAYVGGEQSRSPENVARREQEAQEAAREDRLNEAFACVKYILKWRDWYGPRWKPDAGFCMEDFNVYSELVNENYRRQIEQLNRSIEKYK